MSDDLDLRWGHTWSLPKHVRTAWGARLIYPDDVVWDRQDATGPRKDELLAHLRDVVGDAPWRRARELDDKGAMSPRDELDWILYEDAQVRVIGNPHKSFGYLYVVAYFRSEE